MNNNLLQEYCQWVKFNGHLTKYADSVLKEFIKEKGYNRSDYESLEKELGF